jgi:two-component system, OmpR family, sensor histidine kinase SenX3
MGKEEIGTSVVGHLLALLAHDLRNPLSALHSNVAFLSSVLNEPDEDVADALADGMVSCDGLTHIIDNIDLLGQCLRQSSFPPHAPLGVLALVEEVLRRCQRMASSHSVDVVLEPAQLTPIVEVTGIRDLLVRALSNLVQNCVQNSPPRSQVVVSIRLERRHVAVLVLDHCQVLDPAMWEQIFTPEGQIAAKSSSAGRYSRGLGLYAAQLAAMASGASVQVVPAPSGFANALELRLPLVA